MKKIKCHKCGFFMKEGEYKEYSDNRPKCHKDVNVCVDNLNNVLKAIEVRLNEMVIDGLLTIEEVNDVLGIDF